MSAATPRLVLIATPPRCGSMWLYNVCRSVLRTAGLTPAPDDVQVYTEDLDRTVIAAGRSTDEKTVFVAKTHRVIGPPQPGILVATILRDPRDMALSYRRFVGSDELDVKIIDRVASVIATFEKLEHMHAASLLTFRYDDIVSKPAEVVGALRAALALPTDADADRAIALDYAPENVERIIAKADVNEQIGRAFDPKTGFQSGHIRGGGAGDGAWRREIAPDTLADIDDRFGVWLERHGFPRA